jgi:hypothetical protein
LPLLYSLVNTENFVESSNTTNILNQNQEPLAHTLNIKSFFDLSIYNILDAERETSKMFKKFNKNQIIDMTLPNIFYNFEPDWNNCKNENNIYNLHNKLARIYKKVSNKSKITESSKSKYDI